mgnify:CR=1 FL=1
MKQTNINNKTWHKKAEDTPGWIRKTKPPLTVTVVHDRLQMMMMSFPGLSFLTLPRFSFSRCLCSGSWVLSQTLDNCSTLQSFYLIRNVAASCCNSQSETPILGKHQSHCDKVMHNACSFFVSLSL